VGAEDPDVLSILAMARAQLPDVKGLTDFFTVLAWAKPVEGEKSVMSAQELMLLMESGTRNFRAFASVHCCR
jgi:hypothetical protein